MPPSTPGAAPVANSQPPPVPPELMGYMRWLQRLDAQRAELESAARAALPSTGLTQLEPRGRGGSSAAAAQAYQRWADGLQDLQRRYVRLDGLAAFQPRSGSPRVPEECGALHRTFGLALAVQSRNAGETAGALAAQDPAQLRARTRDSAAVYPLLQQADGEIQAIATRYGIAPWFRIAATPGATSAPPR